MKRVVVTGLGIIAPCGEDKNTFYKNLIQGKSCTELVENFDVSLFNSKIAAQDLDFDPLKFGITDHQRMDRYVQFAVAAGKQAVGDSNLDMSLVNSYRAGVALANAICGTRFMEEEFLLVTDWGKKPINPQKARPYLYDAAMFNTPSTEISSLYGLRGINCTISTGCTAGTDSIGFAFELIRDGRQDLIVSGASEAPITPITFGAFDVINALSKRNNPPNEASCPFDKRRDGFVISEGCGILVLEELEHALGRGAHIYCEIIGYGTSCNAYHMTDLPQDGQAMVQCLEATFKDAGIEKEKIDYINAHGSSTPQNDVFETNAYKTFFGDYAYKLPISSIKSMVGHPLAAANALESVLCAMIFQHNILPPTINQKIPDLRCDLDYIPNKAREKKVDYILKTSSGFSGIHSSLIFKRWQEK
ncbi:MAG: beta-ketoacyl-[acyl-carrier-protein] synthase family protein [Candidatus Omnitrophica bacterium]|nr:beta-ketoacyl-[acyl-carrier-protein] synthase family protein [Candidatus Omnitrophota bacterium]MBU2436395.1 beta-ketoacyl-[acyl-carrier-protein] synthase family protein [Candidatus Omnitrophota bacterium]